MGIDTHNQKAPAIQQAAAAAATALAADIQFKLLGGLLFKVNQRRGAIVKVFTVLVPQRAVAVGQPSGTSLG